jgi:predicted nucleic acid-binding protein
MSGYLLDTNCISELVRLKPEPRVMAWMQAAEETLLYLSVLTLGEIRKGLAGLPQGKRRTHLETWLEIELGLVLPAEFCRSMSRSRIGGAYSQRPQKRRGKRSRLSTGS